MTCIDIISSLNISNLSEYIAALDYILTIQQINLLIYSYIIF